MCGIACETVWKHVVIVCGICRDNAFTSEIEIFCYRTSFGAVSCFYMNARIFYCVEPESCYRPRWNHMFSYRRLRQPQLLFPPVPSWLFTSTKSIWTVRLIFMMGSGAHTFHWVAFKRIEFYPFQHLKVPMLEAFYKETGGKGNISRYLHFHLREWKITFSKFWISRSLKKSSFHYRYL